MVVGVVATAAEVAKLAGVSQSTVSYVMSGTRSISGETRERVLAAMRELSYQPNASARALAGRRTSVIGLVVRLAGDTQIPSTYPFIETVTEVARRREYDVVLATGEEGPAEIQRLAMRSIVDAIVLMDIRRKDPRVDVVPTVGVPVVLIGVPDAAEGLHCFDLDSETAGRLAVLELADSGSSEVVLVGEPAMSLETTPNAVARFERGARAEARRRGVTVRMRSRARRNRAGLDDLRRAVRQWAGRRTGVVARSPATLDALLDAFLLEGIEPGADMPLVALCSDDHAESRRVSVTNVSPEAREISRRAMEAVLALLDGTSRAPGVELVTPRLTRRETTG